MRLLLRDTETGQKINDRFGLHFQFAGQLVDSDLVRVAHALRSLLGPLTPALPLPPVPLRLRFLLLVLRPARLPLAPSLQQQRFRPKLPLRLVAVQQFPPRPLLPVRPLPRLRLGIPQFPRSPRFHSLPHLAKRFHRTGSRPGRFCPPSFRRYREFPSIAPASSRRVFLRS